MGKEVDDVSVSLSVNPSLSVKYQSNCPLTSPSGSLHKHAHHINGAAANCLTPGAFGQRHKPSLCSLALAIPKKLTPRPTEEAKDRPPSTWKTMLLLLVLLLVLLPVWSVVVSWGKARSVRIRCSSFVVVLVLRITIDTLCLCSTLHTPYQCNTARPSHASFPSNKPTLYRINDGARLQPLRLCRRLPPPPLPPAPLPHGRCLLYHHHHLKREQPFPGPCTGTAAARGPRHCSL